MCAKGGGEDGDDTSRHQFYRLCNRSELSTLPLKALSTATGLFVYICFGPP